MKKIQKLEQVNWSAVQLSNEICEMFLWENTFVINEMWCWHDKEIPLINQWLDEGGKVVVVSGFDPPTGLKEVFGDRRGLYFIDNTKICFWLLAVDRFFIKYSDEETLPTDFHFPFLCLQRKPRENRKWLYEKLKGNKGLITLGDIEYEGLNENLPHHKGYEEVFTEGNQHLYAPNDIWSLGNLRIWNRHFLNIVSETWQEIDRDGWFVSEKVWKPIIGGRPFLVYGHPKTSEGLRGLGFETFDEDFHYDSSKGWKGQCEELERITNEMDCGMWEGLKGKVEHNRRWFPTAAEREWKKVKELAEMIRDEKQ